MTELNDDDDLELTDVLLQLNEGEVPRDSVKAGIDIDLVGELELAADADIVVDSNDPGAAIAQLRNQLAATKSALREREQALLIEQQRVQDLRQQLASSESEDNGRSKNPFDMMLTLSSEREAALRERKLFKERATNAEAAVTRLESDLAAAYANAKTQVEQVSQFIARCDDLQSRVEALQSDKHTYEKQIATLQAQACTSNTTADVVEPVKSDDQPDEQQNDALTALRQLLRVRDNRIVELEGMLSDRVGAPTLIGGELERIALNAFPTTLYALESLDEPGEIHKLTRNTTTIGRSAGNDITLESPSISRYHARLMSKPEGVWLFDLRSVNGCQVNDHRTSSQLLNEGDVVTIGERRFKFSVVQQAHLKAATLFEQA